MGKLTIIAFILLVQTIANANEANQINQKDQSVNQEIKVEKTTDDLLLADLNSQDFMTVKLKTRK